MNEGIGVRTQDGITHARTHAHTHTHTHTDTAVSGKESKDSVSIYDVSQSVRNQLMSRSDFGIS